MKNTSFLPKSIQKHQKSFFLVFSFCFLKPSKATCKISSINLLQIKIFLNIFNIAKLLVQSLQQVFIMTWISVITHHHPHTNLLPSVQRALYTPNTQKGDSKSYLNHYHQNDTRDGVAFDFQ